MAVTSQLPFVADLKPLGTIGIT